MYSLKKGIINILIPCCLCLLFSTSIIYFFYTYYLFPILNISINMSIIEINNHFLSFLISDVVFIFLFVRMFKSYFKAIADKNNSILLHKLKKLKRELIFSFIVVLTISLFSKYYVEFACIFLPFAFVVLTVAVTFYQCCIKLCNTLNKQ